MTRDEFASAYDVHKLVVGGPVRSYFGRSRATRVVALVHYLDGGDSPENAARLARVAALVGEGKRLVLDVCEVDGTPVVVTRFILNFTSFDAWLAAEAGTAEPPGKSVDARCALTMTRSRPGVPSSSMKARPCSRPRPSAWK